MKKYLITGLAAVAISGMFTSCTHETDAGAGGTNLGVVETYEQAFISRFGTPSPDADWGFGPTTTQAGTRANTRAIQPEHNFANDAIAKPTTITTSTGMSSTNFLEDVPTDQGITYYNNINNGSGFGGDQSCYIDKDVKQVNIYNNVANANLYVKGDCSSSLTSFYLGGNSNIYLLKNSKLTISNGFQGNCKVYIAEGAKLTIKNSVSTGNVSYYVKGGSIEVTSSMVVNGNNELFIEDGSLSVNGQLQIQYSNFYAKNTTLSVQNLDLKGDSFHFENGEITYTNGNLSVDDTKFYIKDTDLSVPGNLNLISPTTFYNEGGTITCTGELKANSSKFYSSGNSQFSYIEANGSGVIYNGANATMTSTGQIKLTNYNNDGTGSTLINDGDLVGTYLGTEGSALFQNNGNTTISGDTRVDSNNNTWVNNGHYTTNNFIYRALSDNVINNCHLKVNNLFSIQLGSTWPLDYESIKTKGFRMDANCGVETKDFEFKGPGFIHMGSNSVFKVSGTAYMGITNDIYGIYGPVSGDYAVFQAGSIVRGNNIDANQGFVANYYKHLYVVTGSHFDFGWSNVAKDQWEGHVEGQWDQPYYRLADGAALYTGTEKPSITITPTNCNPGFTGGDDDDDDDETDPVIRVMAEDMGDQTTNEASDFDFNDVVFDVTYVSEGKVKIKILAAGGTLPLTVGWDGIEDPNVPKAYIKHEVHYMLGYSESTMINTNSTVGNHIDGVAPYEFEFTGTFSKANFAQDVRDYIPVKVRKNGVWYDINAQQGRAPGKIAVGTDYNPWCDERVDIDDWWQDNDLKGLFYLYTKNPATLTKFWYKQATHRNGEPISK